MREHISPVKDRRQWSSGSWPRKKQAGTQRSVAAVIASQRILGASEMLPWHRLQRIPWWRKASPPSKMERGKNRKTFREKMKASDWAFDKIKEAFDLVAKDEARKVSIVQEVMFKSTDNLRRIIAPVEGQGRSHNVLPMPALQQLPSGRLRLVGLWGKHTKWCCAMCGEKVRLETIKQAVGRACRESFEQEKVF